MSIYAHEMSKDDIFEQLFLEGMSLIIFMVVEHALCVCVSKSKPTKWSWTIRCK